MSYNDSIQQSEHQKTLHLFRMKTELSTFNLIFVRWNKHFEFSMDRVVMAQFRVRSKIRWNKSWNDRRQKESHQCDINLMQFHHINANEVDAIVGYLNLSYVCVTFCFSCPVIHSTPPIIYIINSIFPLPLIIIQNESRPWKYWWTPSVNDNNCAAVCLTWLPKFLSPFCSSTLVSLTITSSYESCLDFVIFLPILRVYGRVPHFNHISGCLFASVK